MHPNEMAMCSSQPLQPLVDNRFKKSDHSGDPQFEADLFEGASSCEYDGVPSVDAVRDTSLQDFEEVQCELDVRYVCDACGKDGALGEHFLHNGKVDYSLCYQCFVAKL